MTLRVQHFVRKSDLGLKKILRSFHSQSHKEIRLTTTTTKHLPQFCDVMQPKEFIPKNLEKLDSWQQTV